MTKAYIALYARAKLVSGPGGAILQVPEEPPIAELTVDYTAGVTQSAALDPKAKFARVHVDSIASRLIGANPTATVSNARMIAGQTEFLGLPADHGSGAVGSGTVAYKYSFVTNT